MEPTSVITLVFAIVLVCERLWKYTVAHIKKSKCCGSEVEFEHKNVGE